MSSPSAEQSRHSWPWATLAALLLCLLLPWWAPNPVRADPVVAPDGLVVESIPVDNMDLESAAQQVRLLLSPQGVVIIDARTRRLVVKETRENLDRIRQYLKGNDRAMPMVSLRLAFAERSSSSGSQAGVGPVVVTNKRVDAVVTANAGSASTALDSQMSLMVASGGEGVLSVSEQVPFTSLQFFHQWALARGFIGTGVIFQQVGAGFGVSPRVLANGDIMVRVYPRLSYFSPQGNGVIRAMEAATEVRLAPGQTLAISTVQSDREGVARQILAAGRFRDLQSGTILVSARIVK